jgi:PAS domain S-box-containing protein
MRETIHNKSGYKRAEIKLRKTEKNSQLLINSVKDYAIFLIDNDGCIVSWNSGAESIKGYNAKEIIGRHMDIFYTPEEILKGEPKNNLKMALMNGHFETEGWRLRKNGSAFFANIVFTSLVDEEGNPCGYAKVTRDITERKKTEAALDKINFDLKLKMTEDHNSERGKSEQDLKTAHERLSFHIENAPLGFIEWDNQLHVLHWSKRSEEIFGWTETEFISMKTNGYGLVYKEDFPLVSKIAKQLITGEVERNSVVHRNHTKDGRVIWCEWFNSVLRDKTGKVITVLSLVQDITDRKHSEEELRQSQERLACARRNEQVKIIDSTLQAQEKERNNIGIELHDNVNQVLVATKLCLSLVKNDPVKNAEMINACIDNLQNAIDENRKIAHELVAPDFGTECLSDQIICLTDKMLKTAGIEIRFDSSNLQENLLNDKHKLALYRIVQEQCTNIIKYAQASLVDVSLSSMGGIFKMILADNGIGMETGKKTKGIGLRNIKGRVSVFYGHADIITSKGKGFKLEITIPLEKCPIALNEAMIKTFSSDLLHRHQVSM